MREKWHTPCAYGHTPGTTTHIRHTPIGSSVCSREHQEKEGTLAHTTYIRTYTRHNNTYKAHTNKGTYKAHTYKGTYKAHTDKGIMLSRC